MSIICNGRPFSRTRPRGTRAFSDGYVQNDRGERMNNFDSFELPNDRTGRSPVTNVSKCLICS